MPDCFIYLRVRILTINSIHNFLPVFRNALLYFADLPKSAAEFMELKGRKLLVHAHDHVNFIAIPWAYLQSINDFYRQRLAVGSVQN